MVFIKKILGTRILKTGFAVTLALLLTQLLDIESSFAGVVALIGMKQTTKKSLHYGSTLLLGSIISIALGLLFGMYIGTGPVAFGLSTVIGIAILVAFTLTEGLILAIVVMYHVLEAFPISDEIWTFLSREIIIVFIGIVVSVAINIIAPQRFNKQIQENIQSYYHLFHDYLNQITEAIRTPSIARIIGREDFMNHRLKLRQLIQNAEISKENCLTAKGQKQYDQLIYQIKLLQKLLTIIEDMSIELKRISGTYIYSEQVAKAIDLLAKIQYDPEKTTLSSYKRIFVSLDHLRQYFNQSPLPESRQEFVDRSSLHHLFLYTNDYIDVLFLLRDPF